MELSKKRIQEFKELLEKEHGREFTLEEAADAARRLIALAEICLNHYKTEYLRKNKLKDHPKGFHLEDGGSYSCKICNESISNEKTWWDLGGIKCLHCQSALDRKQIPKKVCKDKDLWYSTWEFDYYFDIKTATVNKYVRQGKLKPRVIKNIDTKKEHFKIFLISDNEGVLPQKPKSHLVTDEKGRTHIEYEKIDLKKELEELTVSN